MVIDTNKEAIAIAEANKLNIPVVAVLDSNSDPHGVDYPVPGNDDAVRAINLYCELVAEAVLDGIQQEMVASGVDIGSAEEPVKALPDDDDEITETLAVGDDKPADDGQPNAAG